MACFKCSEGVRQQYPPDSYGFQNIFKDFPTNNDVTENGKEVRRAGGSQTAKRSQPGNREAVLRGLRGNRGVPPRVRDSP